MSTLASIVRGQVAELYGKFRPATGLDAEERKGVAAERQEFASRVVSGLEELDHSREVVVKHFRRIVRELRNEPSWAKMPTAEGIVSRVRRCVEQGIERPMCAACVRMGGAPGVFGDSPMIEQG